MIIHREYKGLNLNDPVVTMGIFDGVHLGHKSLLDFLVKRAQEKGRESVVVTFDPHPRIVLDRNRESLSFLSSMDEKTDLLEKAAIGHLIIIRFTSRFRKIKACDFIRRVLVDEIGARHLIVGYDHHFGYNAEGNYDTIRDCAASMGFMVEQVPGLTGDKGAISSSSIREALLKGRVEEAAGWLGYNYRLKGNVVKGRKIGRMIGFPTANIRPDFKYKLIPADGVYAVEVLIEGRIFKGMLSIGVNPTVNASSGKRSIEVNIFDFNREIYGREVNIIFRYRLRDEMKFESMEELSGQIVNDESVARRLLA